VKDNYGLIEGNGYNCFHNAGTKIGLRETDVTGDPRFVDPGSGDFRLRDDSSCLNAGKPTLDGGFSDIGATARLILGIWRYCARDGLNVGLSRRSCAGNRKRNGFWPFPLSFWRRMRVVFVV